MAAISQYHTSGENVYARIYRFSGGARQVYNVVNGTWESFSSGSVAEYNVDAVEEGASGTYVIDLSAEISGIREVRWAEWYVKSGPDPLESDVQISAYMLAYDSDSEVMLPPIMHVSQSEKYLNVNVGKIGNELVDSPEDIGARLEGLARGFSPFLPTGVDVDVDVYMWDVGDDAQILQNPVYIDPKQDFSCDLTFNLISNGNLYIGFGRPADDINNVLPDLILPDEANTDKDQFYNGWILSLDNDIQQIVFLSGKYFAFPIADTKVQTGQIRLVWDARGKFLSLYTVQEDFLILEDTIPASSTGAFVSSQDAALEITANELTGSLQVWGINGRGKGFVGRNAIPATANLDRVLGTSLTETNTGDVAEAVSHFFDVDAPGKTINDVGSDLTEPVQADIVRALGVDITETNAGDVANAISHYFDVPVPEKTINDVGSDLTEPVQADIVRALGADLTEVNVGGVAGALSYYFDVDTPEKTMNDVGGSAPVGTVDANIVQALGVSITETNAGDVAEAISHYFDVDTPEKTMNDVGGSAPVGTVDANIVQALGADLTEANVGGVAGALSHFFDVPVPEKTINDVGSSAPVGIVDANIVQAIGSNLTEVNTGGVAEAMSHFFDVPVPEKTINDVGSSAPVGIVDANIVQAIGSNLTETNVGDVAGALSHYFDVDTPEKTMNDVGGSTPVGTVDANIVQALGADLTEANAGGVAGALSYFFDVDTPEKTINDVGGSTPVGIVDANIVQAIGSNLTETNTGDVAEAISHYFNVDTPEKTMNDVGGSAPVGIVDANIVQAIGSSLTETSTGDVAEAMSHFFDVDTPEKTINDVGGSDLTEPIQADIVKILHTDLSESQLGAIAAALSYFFNVDVPKKNMNEVGSDLTEPVDANVVGWLGNAPEELIEIDDIWSDGIAINTNNGKILEVGTVTDGAKETAATVNKDAIIAHGGPGDWTTGSGATVTNISVSAPTQVATPISGEEAVEITITALCKAGDGSPENVTSPSWVVEGFITGDRSADWKDVGENPDIGTYKRVYLVKSTAAIEDLVFKFAGEFADGTDRVGQASTILRDGEDTGAVVVGEMSLAALQQFVQDNTGLPVAATQSVADLSKGDGGSVAGSTYSPVLQHDVDSGFIFKMQRRSSGALGSTNAITIYLGETPRFGFGLAQVLKSKPRHILSLVVVPADSGLDVEVDDADTLGVRDYLAMSRFKNAAIAGNYVVQITVETFSGETVTAEGTVVVKPVSSVNP